MNRPTMAINGLAVRGFKSISTEQGIDIRPLTLLAGPNSSGKSSIMQPLLLLKQTIEAPADPGALLLDGPNVRFSSSTEVLSRAGSRTRERTFSVRLSKSDGDTLELTFRAQPPVGFEIDRMLASTPSWAFDVTPGMSSDDIAAQLPGKGPDGLTGTKDSQSWHIARERCFLSALVDTKPRRDGGLNVLPYGMFPAARFLKVIKAIIHLPGLRGDPRRTYSRTAVGGDFSGTFEAYVASLISFWQTHETMRLHELAGYLEDLGLSWKVSARAINDTQVELLVGRLPHAKRGGAQDLVNVADVGFGVSQSLPVLVALTAARPGQLVYLEQPEIHLHPKAQRRLATILCKAANRGVRVVVETHSALLLRQIQTLVAKKTIEPEDVALHWFSRDDRGSTIVSTATLDSHGAYGDWPEDFDETELDAEQDYLDAVEQGAGK